MAVNQVGLGSASVSSPSQSRQSQSPLPVDENGDLEVHDPKLSTTKRILESVFGDRSREETPSELNARLDSDTVEISQAAVELQQKQRLEVTARTADGGEVKVVVQREESLRVAATGTQGQQPQQSDPLVIDLDNNGVRLTDVRAGGGVSFDITGDGTAEQVSWIGNGDGFLAMDRNGNGIIDDGRELFGDQHGAVDGFAELAKLDGNGDGRIDSRDAAVEKLRIWQDTNMNGVTDEGELKSLSRHGIESLSIRPVARQTSVAGNMVSGFSSYQRAASSGIMADAWLNYLV